MDGGCISQGDFIQFANVVGDESALKVNRDLAFLDIHLGYLPDVTVVDILLVVIDRLEDFIARGIGPTKSGNLWRGIRIQGLLEHSVEGPCAQTPSVHWGEHLYIANGMEPKALGNAFGYHTQEFGLDLLRAVYRNDVKVTGPVLRL